MGKGIDSDEYGGHKCTRFPFLATARYAVAAVVSVLTVAVVVMVIIVALRPEKVIFSIPQQYIEADRLWWADPDAMTPSSEQAPIPSRVGGRAVNTNAAGTKTAEQVIINDPDTASCFSCGTTETTTTTFPPVKNVNFHVSFTADNPSGRADVSGENVTIRVLDMPDYGSPNFSFTTTRLTEIVMYELHDHFSVKRQTSHTLMKWILVNNTAVLSYLAEKYGGSTNFTAMVQVNATIVTAASVKKKPEPQIYYCWPVTVGTSDYYYEYDSDRSTFCMPEKEMDSHVTYNSTPPPALVPAPAPAAAPTAAAR